MDDTSADGVLTEPSPPRALLEAALATAIDRFGPALFFDPDRLRLLLVEATTAAPKEIDVLLKALSETVPQTLLAAHGNEVDALLRRLVKQVMKNSSVERGPATWAVRTWVHALALPTHTIDAPSRSMAAHPTAADGGVDFASVITPRTAAVKVAHGNAVAAAPTEPGTERLPFVPVGTMDATSATSPSEPPAASVPTPVDDRVEALSAFVPLEPVFVQAPRSAEREGEPVVPEAMSTAATSVETQSVPGSIDGCADVSSPWQPPEWAQPETTRPRPPAWFARWRGRAIVVLVLMAIGFVGIATINRSRIPPPESPTPSATRADPSRVEPSRSATRAAMPAGPSDEHASTAMPTTVAPARDRDLAGMLGSNAPTAVGDTTPGGPIITRVTPQSAVVGKGFSVALSIDGDPERIASIERRVVASDTRWPTDATTSPARTLARTKAGALIVPFRPIAEASTSTLQFTAVDHSGVRGPPQSVTLRVVDPPGKTIVAATTGRASGVAAAPGPAAKRAESVACTKSSCGTVVSVREFETGRAGNYEMIVRMDDRKIHAIVQTNRWRSGTRVRLSGNRYVEVKH